MFVLYCVDTCSNDWVDCLTTPSLTVSILSKIHPVYVVPDFDMSDDAQCSSPSFRCMRQGRDFDATQMEPDVVNIHIETAPIVACAYGSLIRAIIILQVCICRLNAHLSLV